MLKKISILLLVTMLSFNTACGTITGWNKTEPFKNAVIFGNLALLLLGGVPGVVGFIVDHVNDKL